MNLKVLKAGLIFSTLLVSNLLIGQSINFERLKISEIEAYEKTQNSTPKDTVKFGILKNPHKDLETLIDTKAFIFRRNEDKFNPQLHVWYYFVEDSEKIQAKCYNWGLYNPAFNPSKNEKLLIKLSKKEEIFVKKYSGLEKELNELLGEPFKKETIADNDSRFVEVVFWEDESKIVELSINFERKLNKIPGIGIFANFQIEVMITYK